jgi:hypothetical protein
MLDNEKSAKPNGSAPEVEPDWMDFDTEQWRSTTDVRLDPERPVPAACAKVVACKPPKDDFVRAHPDPAFSIIVPLYTETSALYGNRRSEPYLLKPGLPLSSAVVPNIEPTRLTVSITGRGRVFLWTIKQSGNLWHASAENILMEAMRTWVKVIPDLDEQAYRFEVPEAKLAEPTFPDLKLEEYLQRAFKSRFIRSIDHQVIQRLAGRTL